MNQTVNPSTLVALSSNSSEACLHGVSNGNSAHDSAGGSANTSDGRGFGDGTAGAMGPGAIAMLYALDHASAMNGTTNSAAYGYSPVRCIPDSTGIRTGCHSVGCQCRSFERCFPKFTDISTTDDNGLTMIDVGACGISAWASVVLLGGPLAFCIAFCMYVQFAYFELSVQIMLPHQFPRMMSASGF